MDNLPLELYLEIFKYLNLDNLLNVQLVSKKFKFICTQLRISDLLVDNRNHQLSTNSNYIQLSTLNRSKRFNLEKNLKFLFLFSCKTDSQIKLINHFKELNQLHLSIDIYFESKINEINKIDTINTIELPKLRTFSVTCYKKDFKLILKTEKLEFIEFLNYGSFSSFDTIEFKLGILNIKKIISFNYRISFEIFNLIELHIGDLNNFDRDILMKFKNLEIFNFFYDYCKSIEDFKLLEAKNVIRYILNQKEELNRINFNLYCADILIKNISNSNYLDILNENGYFNRKNLKFHIQNLDLLNDNSSKYYSFYGSNNLSKYLSFYNYNDLINLSSNQQLLFFNKFNNIRKIEVSNKITNQDHFLWFLSKLTKLTEIYLINTELDQQFYNKLSLSARSLLYLMIVNEDINFKLINNYNFLNDLIRLNLFTTNYSSSVYTFDLICKLNETKIFEIIFKFNKFDFEIKMGKEENYDLIIKKEINKREYSFFKKLVEFKNLDLYKLIRFLEIVNLKNELNYIENCIKDFK